MISASAGDEASWPTKLPSAGGRSLLTWALGVAMVGAIIMAAVSSRITDPLNVSPTLLTMRYGGEAAAFILIAVYVVRLGSSPLSRRRGAASVGAVIVAVGFGVLDLPVFTGFQLEALSWLGFALVIIGGLVVGTTLSGAGPSSGTMSGRWPFPVRRGLLGLLVFAVGLYLHMWALIGWLPPEANALGTVGGPALVVAGLSVFGLETARAIRFWRRRPREQG
jgi:hypothetical protein